MQLGICCSPLRRQLALRLSSRLERNLGMTTTIVADESAPLMESWEQASASDAVLLMLDRNSAPGPVKRDEWRPLLERTDGPPVATLKLERCFYPKLLERSRFLEAGGNELEIERWVERWLVNISSAREGIERQRISSCDSSCPAEWWTKAVDIPGVLAISPSNIDAVQRFAYDAGPQFHSVVWMGCEGVPPEALTAEIEFRCAVDSGRRLFVLVHADPDVAILPRYDNQPRHSFVIVEGHAEVASTGRDDEALIGACRPSGFPGALLDSMLGHERRNEWEDLIRPLTVDRRWYRPRRVVAPNPRESERHLEVLRELFREWRRQQPLCRELVGEAAWAIQRDQLASGELCYDLAKFLLAEKRLTEGVTWLRILAASEDERDEFAIKASEELRWLVDEFGSYRAPEPIMPGDQVAFPFPEFFVDAQSPSETDRALLEELEADLAEYQQRTAAESSSRSSGRQLQFDLFS